MSQRRAWDDRDPLAPPPPELVDAYRASLAAAAERDRVLAGLPTPWSYVIGGESWPHEHLAAAHEASDAASKAAVRVFEHPWYRGAQDRAEATRVLRESAESQPGPEDPSWPASDA